MTQRQIELVFTNFVCSKLTFARSVADFACRGECVPALVNKGILTQLPPLMSDPNPTVQHAAVQALGRIADSSCESAKSLVECDLVGNMICCFNERSACYKLAAAFCLKSIAKHNEDLAKSIVDLGSISVLVCCLEDFTPAIKEAAIIALGSIAKHNADLAWCVVNSGAVPLLILALQEPDVSIRSCSAAVLADICKHCLDLAYNVVEAGAICYLVSNVNSCVVKLKRNVLTCLCQICKHSINLAELVIESEVLPCVLLLMRDCDLFVRKKAVTLISEIVKHSCQLSSLVCNNGGIAALVDFVSENRGCTRMAAILSIGYIAGQSESLAIALLKYNAAPVLSCCLFEEGDERTLSTVSWSLGELGKHSTEHAHHIAVTNILPKLLQIMQDAALSDDVKTKAKKALKLILSKCCHLAALYPLMEIAPENILQHILCQFAKVLPNDTEALKCFVTSGGLRRLQTLCPEAGSDLAFTISSINCLYPEEIVKYYTPGYPDQLLDRIG